MKLDFTVHPHKAKIHRPLVFGFGVLITIIGVLMHVFDDVWKPSAYQFLGSIGAGSVIVGTVPYFGLLLLFVGMYITDKGRERPFIETEKRVLSKD